MEVRNPRDNKSWIAAALVISLLSSVSYGAGLVQHPPALAVFGGQVTLSEVASTWRSEPPHCSDCVVANISVGADPWTGAFDPATGDILIPDSATNQVTLLSGSSNQVLRTATVGEDPSSNPVFDSATNEFFVSNLGSDNVSVISATASGPVHNIPLEGVPSSPSVFGTNGTVYVRYVRDASCPVDPTCQDDVAIISPSTWKVSQNISLNSPYVGPVESYYPPPCIAPDGDVFMGEFDSDNVSLYSPSAASFVKVITVGIHPWVAGCDPTNGNVYVPDVGSGELTVISGRTNGYLTNISVGPSPSTPSFDTSEGTIFDSVDTSSFRSGNVSMISSSTNQVIATTPVGVAPVTPVYDPWNNEVYVACQGSNEVVAMSGFNGSVLTTIPVGSDPVGVVLDNTNGELFVSDSGSASVSVIAGGAPPPLNVSARVSPASATVGESVAFSAGPTGGVPPYVWSWRFGDGGSGGSQNVSHAFSSPGVYTARLWVNDSADHSATSSVRVTVVEPTPQGLSLETWYLLLFVLSVILAAVSAFLVVRRRRRLAFRPAEPGETGQAQRSQEGGSKVDDL